MAIFQHPFNGVNLNVISLRRGTLGHPEAVTAWLMHFQGVAYHEIAAHLGVNAFEVGKVLNGQIHGSAKAEAVQLFFRHRDNPGMRSQIFDRAAITARSRRTDAVIQEQLRLD